MRRYAPIWTNSRVADTKNQEPQEWYIRQNEETYSPERGDPEGARGRWRCEGGYIEVGEYGIRVRTCAKGVLTRSPEVSVV